MRTEQFFFLEELYAIYLLFIFSVSTILKNYAQRKASILQQNYMLNNFSSPNIKGLLS